MARKRRVEKMQLMHGSAKFASGPAGSSADSLANRGDTDTEGARIAVPVVAEGLDYTCLLEMHCTQTDRPDEQKDVAR